MALEMKYFVLKPRSKSLSDPFAYASRIAMLTYADQIEVTDSKLAQELRQWVYREDRIALTLT